MDIDTAIIIIMSPREIKQVKEVKDIQIRKEVKLSLFVDAMILYNKNPEGSTKILSVLINKFSKITGYKINIEKSVACL